MKFTADTHFGSERALTLSKRPFESVANMDTFMIEYWNSHVAPNEDVYHAGDFGNYSVVKKLNGNIHLILGNYEYTDIDTGNISVQQLINIGFASVQDTLYLDNFITELPELKKLKIVHEPSKCDIGNPEIFNLFGHIHGKQMCKPFGLDIGVDAHHMRIIDSADVAFFVSAIKKFYDNEVFMH